jgi:hypothetical protein
VLTGVRHIDLVNRQVSFFGIPSSFSINQERVGLLKNLVEKYIFVSPTKAVCLVQIANPEFLYSKAFTFNIEQQ